MVPPPPEGAPAAVQEPVLSIFQGNHLIISGDIPVSDYSDISTGGDIRASDYSDISSLGAQQRRGEAPGASIIITILFLVEVQHKIYAAAPEGRPGGGSGTCPIDFPGKSSDYFRRDPGFRLFGYIFI
jgi:hypothetical protein